MNKKSLLLCLLCYALWGVLPLYWHLLDGMHPLFILCNRIIWSFAFSFILLGAQRRLPELWKTLKNPKLMKFLVPAGIVITINWGLYIWAVNSGFVLDASLGYYINPLAVFLLSILLFKEHCTKLEIGSFILAGTGVLISTIRFGAFPVVALTLAFSFATYGALKKYAHVEPILGIAVETLTTLPFAIAYILIFCRGEGGFASLELGNSLLLIGAGIVTATPMMLYSKGVNDLPFITMGFLQYVSPTLMMVCGLLFLGEALSPDKLISFLFIWAGLVLFSIGMVREEKAKAKTLKNLEN